MLNHSFIIVLSLLALGGVQAGNTTCLNNSMDWFTQSVGETPCRVYEQLRRLCVPSFNIKNMSYVAPGDKCIDQLGDCCCNSVAFSLSMLCMSCQYGIGSGENGDFDFDAPVGTYAQYLNNCGKATNESLPDSVQKAACNAKLKLPAYIYKPSWTNTGEWYFYYTRLTAQLRIGSGENGTDSRCNQVLVGNGTTIDRDSTSVTSIPSGGFYVKKEGIVGIVF
ncbi:unnamed protein product [Rhizoctonia solani]|uniref:Uncharacterized protein n=1 Tax=Rhizoctonia solani TaxID=456999 RepID=A0A8H3GCK3_9AGAM|nr:unnamed protein product [Rhizoctonia solani]